MNKQRKVVITTTYNEMGIIIDTKAEEVAQPEVAKDTNVLTNDCISRQAVIDALENIDCSDGIGISALKCDVVEDAINAINALPSAQPERKRGKWIEDDDGWDEVIWRCSECDAVFTLVDGTPEENEYYFCPHCGADMRGE